jgi:membrane protein YqaA with SNARE-associated domain
MEEQLKTYKSISWIVKTILINWGSIMIKIITLVAGVFGYQVLEFLSNY